MASRKDKKAMAERPGVEKVLEKSYYEVEDVMALLGVKNVKAYSMMKNTRLELQKTVGLATDYPTGQVPKRAFNERYQIE